MLQEIQSPLSNLNRFMGSVLVGLVSCELTVEDLIKLAILVRYVPGIAEEGSDCAEVVV